MRCVGLGLERDVPCPNGAPEYSPGLSAAIPWESVHQMHLCPEGAAEMCAGASGAPTGHERIPRVTQGRLRCAAPTLGCIPAPRWGALCSCLHPRHLRANSLSLFAFH